MKKYLFFLIFFGLCGALCFNVLSPRTANSNIQKIPIPESAAIKDSPENFIWSIFPQDKTKWPENVLIFWKVTHMKENSLMITKKENWVKLKNIPSTARNALIAIEDRRFYEHSGVDLDSIIRAILVNIQADGIVQGASTLTQQLVKNTVLTSQQTMERKFLEAFFAIVVESQYSKDDILEMYFNTTYFGDGSTGIKAAAQNYFGVEPFQLSLPESATIAALPYAPSALNPRKNLEGCTKRRDLVLTQMSKIGFISSEEAQSALKEPLTLH